MSTIKFIFPLAPNDVGANVRAPAMTLDIAPCSLKVGDFIHNPNVAGQWLRVVSRWYTHASDDSGANWYVRLERTDALATSQAPRP